MVEGKRVIMLARSVSMMRRKGKAMAGSAQRSRRRAVESQAKRFVLKMTGSGSREHLDGVDGGDEYVELNMFEIRESGPEAFQTVGRESTGIIINSPAVSREHARLSVLDSTLYCEDLGSTNGTRINGKKMRVGTSYKCRAGTVLVFGDESLAKYTVYQEADDEEDTVTSSEEDEDDESNDDSDGGEAQMSTEPAETKVTEMTAAAESQGFA